MMVRDAVATRQRILDHAQRQFAQLGYAASTVKGVADAAGVSPNLITRYFGGKEGLFLAATRVQIAVSDSFDGDLSDLGARLAANIVARWFGTSGEDPLLVLHRASGERPEAAEALSAFLDTNSLAPLHDYLSRSGLADEQARSRAEAIDAFVLGVSTRRRVLRSDLGDRGHLQAWLGANIQRLAEGNGRPAPTLTLFCGLPGSGKTTLARRLEADGRGVRLCTDDWQAGLGVDHADTAFHERLQPVMFRHALALLSEGVSVILEDGLWTTAERTEKFAGARECGALIDLHVFDVPFPTLSARLARRAQQAPAGAYPMTTEELHRAWNVFQPPSSAELAAVDSSSVHAGGLSDIAWD